MTHIVLKNSISNVKSFFSKLAVNNFRASSTGLALAEKEGLFSSYMFDYVYNNKPSGISKVGKSIDAKFLNNPAWQAIRYRRVNLMNAIYRALEVTLIDKGRAYICDVASGPASYIFDPSVKLNDPRVLILLRDIDERALKEARDKSRIAGFSNIEFKCADALDESDFRFKSPPSIFIASGFYERIEDENKIQNSIKLIYKSLPANGFFIYTAHVRPFDMKVVTELFDDFETQKLNLAVRPQVQFDAWTRSAGFTLVNIVADLGGFYSVNTVRKIR